MAWEPTILASTTRALFRLAEDAGLERRRLARLSRIDPALLDVDGARIPRAASTAAWQAIERELGDEAVGLRSLAGLSADAFGAVGLLAMSSPTVGQALVRAAEYHHLMKDDIEVRTRWHRDTFVLDEHCPGPLHRAAEDYGLGSYVTFARRWTGVHVRPLEVHFRHAAPDHRDAYEEFFACPLRFGSDVSRIAFGAETAELPLLTAQPDFESYMKRVVRDASRTNRSRDVVEDIRHAIVSHLDAGRLSLENVARNIGASPRTVQRHLALRGFTFQSLVADVRRARALELLRDSELSVDRIGEQLGYSEAAAFRRACKRWTGLPPALLRRHSRHEPRAIEELGQSAEPDTESPPAES